MTYFKSKVDYTNFELDDNEHESELEPDNEECETDNKDEEEKIRERGVIDKCKIDNLLKYKWGP
jgi:hypothetical protein